MKPNIVSRVAVIVFACLPWRESPQRSPRPATRPVNRSDPSGNPLRTATRTGHISNYDEAKAGSYTLPDPLVMANGQPVRDAETWFKQRRPEILELYRSEIYGRVPANAPKEFAVERRVHRCRGDEWVGGDEAARRTDRRWTQRPARECDDVYAGQRDGAGADRAVREFRTYRRRTRTRADDRSGRAGRLRCQRVAAALPARLGHWVWRSDRRHPVRAAGGATQRLSTPLTFSPTTRTRFRRA